MCNIVHCVKGSHFSLGHVKRHVFNFFKIIVIVLFFLICLSSAVFELKKLIYFLQSVIVG